VGLTLTLMSGSDDAGMGQQEQVVVVTGAGTGIGRATARAFAGGGATVFAVGRRPGPLHGTADGDGRIMPLVADVTGAGEPERIVRAVVDRAGRLDVLVNNAGIAVSGALGALDEAAVGRVLATNLVAPVLLAGAALPLLVASGGVIVNVSTAVGARGWAGNGVYAASKAALDSLTRSWAVELAPRGVRVVAVAPGAIDTPIGEHRGMGPEQRAALRKWQLEHTPLGRIGEPAEVARVITALAGAAASFVTGVVLPVDGGAVVG
jgi:NAD(P)-dependent dehydrogenase (short-subunit alcohol dehydrogenase family)